MRSSEISGVHQALDHLEGVFFGIAARRWSVRVLRLLSNHFGTLLTRIVVVLKESKKGVRSIHGVFSQLGEGAASVANGAARVVEIAVWSDPVAGRLLSHLWT